MNIWIHSQLPGISIKCYPNILPCRSRRQKSRRGPSIRIRTHNLHGVQRTEASRQWANHEFHLDEGWELLETQLQSNGRTLFLKFVVDARGSDIHDAEALCTEYYQGQTLASC